MDNEVFAPGREIVPSGYRLAIREPAQEPQINAKQRKSKAEFADFLAELPSLICSNLFIRVHSRPFAVLLKQTGID